MKTWNTLWITLAIMPWLFVISLMTFYFHAGKILGHAPTYNNPDPKELAIYANYEPFVNSFATAWLFAFPIWLVLVIFYLISNRKHLQWKMVAIGATSHFFAICLLFSGIFEWYID
jgi:hypothetical protein